MLQNSLNLVHSALPAFPEIPYPHALRAKRLVKEKKILNDALRGTLKSSHLSIDKSGVHTPLAWCGGHFQSFLRYRWSELGEWSDATSH